MTFWRFIYRDLVYYRRSLLALGAASLLVALVLTAALGVGDSLAHTLRVEVERRLAGVSAVAQWPGVWAVPGSVLKTDAYLRLPNDQSLPVTVYGVSAESGLTIDPGAALVNQPLWQALQQLAAGTDAVLRVAQLPPIAPDSLAGQPSQLRQLHLKMLGACPAEWADFSLRDSQIPALNIFLDRAFLAASLGVRDGGNMIWADDQTPEELAAMVTSHLTPADLGFYLKPMQARLVLKNSAFFLPEWTQEVFPETPKTLTWFAEKLTDARDHTLLRYCFVAGVSEKLMPITPGQCLVTAQMPLPQNDAPGHLHFYQVGDFRTIQVQKTPLAHLGNVDDSTITAAITANIPGLTDAADCASWKSGLPIDLRQVQKNDEQYWRDFGAKPKVYLPLSEAQELFAQNALTSLVFPEDTEPDAVMTALTDAIRARTPGLQTFDPRDTALANAEQGVDFKELFLSLSAMVMIAALICLAVLTRQQQWERHQDVKLLAELGFLEKWSRQLQVTEMGLAIVVGTALGTAAGGAATKALLLALGTVWREVVGRRQLLYQVQGTSLLLAFVVAATLGLLVVAGKAPRQLPLSRRASPKRGSPPPIPRSLLALAWLQARRFWPLHRLTVTLLVLGLVTALGVGSYAIRTRGEEGFGYDLVATVHLPYEDEIESKMPDIVPVKVFQATNADCTNLNRVTMPNVFGLDLTKLGLPEDFLGPNGAAVDRGVLKWILKMNLGDQLTYETGSLTLKKVFAGSIFQGGVVVSLDTFTKLFPEHRGAAMFLLEKNADHKKLAGLLTEYGLQLETAAQRMAKFDAVQNRYLAIFLQLGLLALLLGMGTMALNAKIIVAQRNQEIALLREIGFAGQQIFRVFWLEQILLLGISLLLATVLLIPAGMFANASWQTILICVPVLALAGAAVLAVTLWPLAKT